MVCNVASTGERVPAQKFSQALPLWNLNPLFKNPKLKTPLMCSLVLQHKQSNKEAGRATTIRAMATDAIHIWSQS